MAQNAENIDTDSTNGDNIDNAETKNEKPEEVVMSDDNIDNAAASDNNTDDATSGDDNAENVTKGETSTNDVPSFLLYGRKTTDPRKVKTSKNVDLLGLSLWNLQQMTHLQMKIIQSQQKVMQRKVTHLILLTCECMNFLFKVHQTLRI